ncbi:hypothetical protein EUGRSUZ_H00278 [Eucalyptus grandis]|uniref:Uncharacterized protein n=2 Tax=Eucalyptus grandis TaxID=71139 RepID=A0ACC3JJZ5_EUCGR|nr:hypothetical protein EUGRSUZ_H00278 [Eucalyptus grandis]
MFSSRLTKASKLQVRRTKQRPRRKREWLLVDIMKVQVKVYEQKHDCENDWDYPMYASNLLYYFEIDRTIHDLYQY